MEAGMLCTINGETFHSFTKSTWIGDSQALCNITNNDTSLYDVTKIKLVQGCLGNMPAMKKRKQQVKVHQVNGSKKLHIQCSP